MTAVATRHSSRILHRLEEEAGRVRRMGLLRLRAANALSLAIPALTLTTLRAALYRRAGFRIARRVSFQGRVHILGPGPELYSRLRIGEGTTLGMDVAIQLDADVTIGSNVAVGPGVRIHSGTHMLGPRSCRMNRSVVGRSVVIEDGAWIGASALILPGVTIGEGTVVAAGSVVSESLAPNVLASGNPAIVTQRLPWADR
ncbi:MAG: acyltransferase [Dehalococcoidia bacterium]|nr:acyltransferase [Dehalococcoidia bacterium]